MIKIINFFKTRRVGFYLSCVSALLLFCQSFIYLSGFGSDVEKMSWAAFALSLCGAVLFSALSVSKYTSSYASPALALFSFIAFLQFISRQIIYLSDVFYGGVTSSAIASLNGSFVACAVILILCISLAVAGIFTRQYKAVTESGGEQAETTPELHEDAVEKSVESGEDERQDDKIISEGEADDE